MVDKNPCLGCNLENEDKNSRTCVECSARVNYVSGLGGMTHSVPVEKTDLVGVPLVGTRNEIRRRRTKGMPQQVVTQKGRAAVKPQAKTGENKMTILKEKIEDIIEKICAEVSVSVANLRAGRRGSKYTVARRKIAKRLIANYGMTQRKIGDLTGVSNQAIAYLLRKNPSSPSATPRQAPASPRQDAGKEIKVETKPATSNTVTIDFSGHAEILEHLGKHAKEEIRSVPDQILYFIQTSLSWVDGEAKRLAD